MKVIKLSSNRVVSVKEVDKSHSLKPSERVVNTSDDLLFKKYDPETGEFYVDHKTNKLRKQLKQK